MNAQAQVINSDIETFHQEHVPHWSASLNLALAQDQGRSYLKKLKHEGPLRIQRPFYPEGKDLCHLYLLHPPGGIVSGDHLSIDAHVLTGAQGLITTPSAGKVYRSNIQGTPQVQQVLLRVEENASLEWLPQETILFNQARAVLATEIHLHPRARLIAWDLISLGRLHSGERFTEGSLQQSLAVWSEGSPLYLDRFWLKGGDSTLQANWGLQGFCCVGTMLIGCGNMPAPQINQLVEALREHLPFHSTLRTGITRLHSLIVVRLLGADMEMARNAFLLAWQMIRPQLLQREAHPPRIWNT